MKGGGTHKDSQGAMPAMAFLHPRPQTITNILGLGCENEPTFGFSLSPHVPGNTTDSFILFERTQES